MMGGVITCDADHLPTLRALEYVRPMLGAFESYLAMRGIKTFPLRMERQCKNAAEVADWLAAHPQVAKVNYQAIRRIPMRRRLRSCFRADCVGRW